MKIKKYEPNGKKIIRVVKSDDEVRLSSSSNGDKGSEQNPYSLGEYITLFLSGEWNGGYVEGVGYVGKEQSAVSFSATDWNLYFSSVFSFLSLSQPYSFPSGGANVSHMSSGNTNNSKTIHSEFYLENTYFDVRVCVLNGTAFITISATSKSEINDREFYIQSGQDSNYLIITSQSSDGENYKYSFGAVSVLYTGTLSLCKEGGACASLV